MTQTKQNRLATYDIIILNLQDTADSLHFDIDALPEYIALCALVTAYEWNERRHTARLAREFDELAEAVRWALFVHWAELRHAGTLGITNELPKRGE